MKVSGKVVLVTGAGRGLGRAIALSLASEGATVAAVSRTREEITETTAEIERRKGRALPVTGDVSVPEDVTRVVEKTVREFGTIDALVNNAGTIGPIGPTYSVHTEDWIRTVHVNLIGTFLCSRAVLPILIKKGHGKIVNIAGSGEGPLANFSAYASSKSAIVRFTETLAEEVRQNKIDVNAVAPGGILTKMTEEIASAQESAGQKEQRRARGVKESGGVKLDVPAQLVVFLASDASNGLTGRLISAVHDNWRNITALRDAVSSTDMLTMRRVDSDLLKRLKLPPAQAKR